MLGIVWYVDMRELHGGIEEQVEEEEEVVKESHPNLKPGTWLAMPIPLHKPSYPAEK